MGDRPLAEAILAEPHNTQHFADPATTEAKVFRGATHDGLGKFRSRSVVSAPGELLNVVEVLRDTNTDIGVSYLPVGSEWANSWYAAQVVEAGGAFINRNPVFIASDKGLDRTNCTPGES